MCSRNLVLFAERACCTFPPKECETRLTQRSFRHLHILFNGMGRLHKQLPGSFILDINLLQRKDQMNLRTVI